MARSKKTAVQNKPVKKTVGHYTNPNITPEKIQEIFTIMESGESFRFACEKVQLPRISVLDIIHDDKNLYDQYTHARQAGLQHKVDTIYETIKNEKDVQRARLYTDTLKWHISKVLPKLYGEKLTVSADVKADVKNTISADFVAMFLNKFGGDDAQN